MHTYISTSTLIFRQLGVVPVTLSMFMSYISAILVLGNTAEMMTYGTEYWLASVGSCLAFLSSGLLFVPLFYPLKLTSSFKVNRYLN